MPEPESISLLPDRIPVFPLPGVLLLPGGRLPLNIFEPRYLEMIADAMADAKLVGMIQPEDPDDRAHEPSIYQTGCVGHISSFKETDDGRYVIVLTGLARFRIERELDVSTGYRQVIPDWQAFSGDLDEEDDSGVDRERLMPALHAFLNQCGIEIDWSTIETAPSAVIVNQLSMICPFQPSEKQALLEAWDLNERSRVMTALVEMALLAHRSGGAPSAAH